MSGTAAIEAKNTNNNDDDSTQQPQSQQHNASIESPLDSGANLDAYKNVGGRDSELGRMLHNLYNKNRNSYTTPALALPRKTNAKSIDPMKAHEAKRAADAAELKKKAYRVRTRAAQPDVTEQLSFVQPVGMRRKPQSQIEAEQAASQLELRKNVPPMRTEAQLHIGSRDDQIRRLQNAMSGEEEKQSMLLEGGLHHLPASKRDKVRQQQATAAARAEPLKSEDEQRLDVLVAEIDERQIFLQQMVKLGQSDKVQAQIKGEISQQLQEIKNLRKRIQAAKSKS